MKYVIPPELYGWPFKAKALDEIGYLDPRAEGQGYVLASDGVFVVHAYVGQLELRKRTPEAVTFYKTLHSVRFHAVDPLTAVAAIV